MINVVLMKTSERGGHRRVFDVTHVDLVSLLTEAYAVSRPQGAGFLHYREGPLDPEEASGIVESQAEARRNSGRQEMFTYPVLVVDYLHGRSVKLWVWEGDPERLPPGVERYMNLDWFDHSDGELRELLDRVGAARD